MKECEFTTVGGSPICALCCNPFTLKRGLKFETRGKTPERESAGDQLLF